MTAAPRRKLIEVALPLDAINAASAREKAIPHGNPSSIHLWWARRPLAACRAVLFAQLVDDPSSRPDEFPTEADQDRERDRLFGIIDQLVKWENASNEQLMEAARAEILKCTDGNPPPIVDPFAGGGSIPLEAQRLGLQVYASDLNPVAVLINKALIEIPPRWAGRAPVHRDADWRTHWPGAEGLVEDLRLYGRWMCEEAERRIGHLYPRVKLDDGSEATVIAWIWVRTATCPNPACRATMPLARSFWLSKKRGNETWINPVIDGEAKTVRFEIRRGSAGPPPAPKVGRAKFRCLVCSETAGPTDLRDSLGVSPILNLARAFDSTSGRAFANGSAPAEINNGGISLDLPELSSATRHMGGVSYGLTNATAFYTARQIRLFTELTDLVAIVAAQCREDSRNVRSGDADVAYADDVAALLSLFVSKSARFHTTLSTWRADRQQLSRAFGGNAMEMTWDFAEANPFAASGGGLKGLLSATCEVIRNLPLGPQPPVEMRDYADALRVHSPRSVVLCTDPPYYDNVPYSDLADFFYVWLRRALLDSEHSSLLRTTVTPKGEELVADAHRHSGSASAECFFQDGLNAFFRNALYSHDDSMPIAFFYAFRQGERIRSADDLLASTGWSTMLEGLVTAGWQVFATWPLLTEGQTRRRGIGSNALMSSVVLACRPRPESAGVTDRRGYLRALRERLPGALHELQKANIAPVDLRQAAIGPGMEVFSSHARVVESDETSMSVRTALGLINQVLDEVLGEQEAEFDAETRWAIQWFSQFFENEGEYGVAEQLAVSMNVAVDGLRRSGIAESGGGKVRLLARAEYPDAWDPLVDDRVPVWEACQHLVKRLEEQGEGAAGDLLARLEQRGSLGEAAQLLAYRLFTVCERTRPALAGPYNALVAAWPEIQRHARNQPASAPAQQTALDT